MNIVALYLGLLMLGLIFFCMHALAPFRIAALLRQRYPQHWNVIVENDQGRPAKGMRLWLRMQHVLRSPAIDAIGDASINRWWRVWRYSQWLAWLCWIAALVMQWRAHT